MIGSQLLELLAARAEAGNPLRVGMIGAGRFGTMFLTQAQRVPGLHVLGIASRSADRTRAAVDQAGWPEDQYSAPDLTHALSTGRTHVSDDVEALIEADGLEVLIEATGNPVAGVQYARKAIAQGRHLVMVNVEADVLAGPLLARQARAAGLGYSLAIGDQPALILELVEWAVSNGFEVVCAGKGTKFLPVYRQSTPDTVWGYYGFSPEKVAEEKMKPATYNAGIDGTKASIEMAAVINATQLTPPPDGLSYPPCGIRDLAFVCRPYYDGGLLAQSGTVEVVSSLERDGRKVPDDIRHGVFVTIRASNEYVRRCFVEYMHTDPSGWYTAVYRAHHLVGLEVISSVLKVGLRGEGTGYPIRFGADVVALAKTDLAAGTELDGEGGYTVYGKLLSAASALDAGALPIGLAHGVRLRRAVAADELVHWSDVECDAAHPVVQFRREMERCMGGD
jgi:predicted homoserine dehydrogenase-like protein